MKKAECLFCESVRRNISFYLIIVSALLMRVINHLILSVGQKMKIGGKKLVEWGSVETPRWTTELLRKAHMVDVEIHMGGQVFRGPLYTMYRFSGDTLVLCLNWVMNRSEFSFWEEEWDEEMEPLGSCSFRLKEVSNPYLIKEDDGDRRGQGNMWFLFRGGWAIIYLGDPKERLVFQGGEEVSRVYAWY